MRPPTNKTLIAIASVLLLIPVVALLWVGSYARETPKLGGFPFFFWYQFLWVFICAGCTYAAHRLVLAAASRAPEPRAIQSAWVIPDPADEEAGR